MNTESVVENIRDLIASGWDDAFDAIPDFSDLAEIEAKDGVLGLMLRDGSKFEIAVTQSTVARDLVTGNIITTSVAYVLRTEGDKEVTFLLAEDGHVVSRSDFDHGEDVDWFIRGASRSHTGSVIPLDQLARGADFAQGWIVDDYHGERRTWGNMKLRSLRLYDDGEW